MMMFAGWLTFGIMAFVNIAMYVMIQMYYEGHPAFTDGDHI
jgi:hypothetical protein